MKKYLSVFFKGIAMGSADVVPGVSGGTIAFITGIYEMLLESIRRINPTLLVRLKNEGIKASWEHINGNFLLALFAGIFTAIISLAKLISYLLVAHPVPVWSFFFGLILVSVWHMVRQVNQHSAVNTLLFILGCGFAYGITVLNPIALEANLLTIFIGGSIAICAMILPGISGSFILLLLGLYTPVLSAVKSFELLTIAVFMLGCLIGLLSFSHLLSYLLKHYKDAMLMALTGLMVGTLGKIWPWKQTISYRTNSKGEQVPLLQENLSPTQFESILNQDAQIGLAILMMLSAVALVLIIERVGQRPQH